MARKKTEVAIDGPFPDPNAKAMWGRTKSQVFKDKTKYTRKKKHKQPKSSDPVR